MEQVLYPVRIAAETVADDYLQEINRHTLQPLKAEEVFTFSGICSNDRIDSHFTKMDPETTLRNYAQDLKTGVSLLEGHDIYKNPYGRSYKADIIVDQEQTSVRGYWYILKDVTINGVNTNDAIRAIEAGIFRDLSVGFGGDSLWFRCSTCGHNLADWQCEHIPGLRDEESQLTFAWVMDAKLREVSTVYKGSTPGAFIEKARAFVEQGQLSYPQIQRLEQEFNVRLDNGKRLFIPGEKATSKEEQHMGLLDQIRQAINENQIEKKAIMDLLSEGEPFRHPEDIALRNELGDFASIEGIHQLKEEADRGRAYLADLIDQAVKARIRAQGDTFNEESYQAFLVRSGDIQFIKGEIESYERQFANKFPTGRQTTPERLGSETFTQKSAFKRENIFE